MTRWAVRAEGLSKMYRIQHPDAPRLRDYLKSPRRSLAAPRSMEVEALRDVTFEVTEGEVFGIIGRNGAGKSTLLKILSRITTPSGGRAMMSGRIASLLEVGTGFHPELSGRDNIYLNGTLLGMRARDVDRVFGEICEFAGVGAYINTPIKRYSSGMQLRLAFAVAAHLAADTMIIDEVLAVGDAEFQAKCTRAMRDAAGRGRTTLFVSHNMAAVENLCTRAVLLEHGRVVETGTAADVVRRYLQQVSVTSDTGLEYVAPGGHAPRSPAIVTHAAVRGAAGGVPTQGEDICVSIDLAVRDHVRRLQLIIWLTTIEGHPVCALSNADHRMEWSLNPGHYRVTVQMREPRLLPRAYAVSLQVVQEWGADVFDDVRNAATFTLTARDVLGTGVPLLANRGVTWLPAQFSLQALGEQAGSCPRDESKGRV